MNHSHRPFLRRSAPSVLLGLATALAATLSAEPAGACGGLFCSSANPVNQTAERIIFASDGQGNITCVVEIQYEGPSDKFSWVLPIPAVSADQFQVGVSSESALQLLQQASNPQYQLQAQFNGDCTQNFSRGFAVPGAALDSGAGGPSVIVVASGTTGPFDWEVISVEPGLSDPADVAVTWLQDNGFDTPDIARETLRPYLADGMNLIAFRLTKTATTGSIRPVVLHYPSDRPFIPIRPTAAAAVEDMGVLVWVLGDARAVPTNYRSLELNESLINWFNPNQNYNDVVIAAANEAGGQGFVTEQAGTAAPFAETIWPSFLSDQVATLSATMEVPALLMQAANAVGTLDGFTDVVRDTVPLRAGVTPEDFAQCVDCYFYDVGIDPYAAPGSATTASDPALGTDPAAFLASLQDQVVGPMETTRKLFEDHAYVTRLYTTLSADEMTTDPEFDFNRDLEDVSNVHTATQTFTNTCGGGQNDPWTTALPSGYAVSGVGTTWPHAVGDMPANTRVLQLSTVGNGEVIEDNQAVIRDALGNGGGCACRSGAGRPTGSAWGLWLTSALVSFVAGRRRTRRAEARGA